MFDKMPLIKGFQSFFKEYYKIRSAMAATLLIVIFMIIAFSADILSIYNPYKMEDFPLLPPSFNHPFGTDNFGRDIYSRVIHGTKTALLIGIGASFIAGIFGIILGAISGYCGGLIDDLFSRAFDIFLVIPRFFLLIVIVAFFSSNILFVMLAIGLTGWVSNARMMRAQVLTLKTRPYIEAIKAIGASNFRILFRHIIPNGIYPIIANTTVQIADAILTEAGLSFLGLGDPNVVSWGKMISDSYAYLTFAPWMAIFPGIFMLLLAFAFNVVGDGINYVFNPRLRA